jgi:hypothetical protein
VIDHPFKGISGEAGCHHEGCGRPESEHVNARLPYEKPEARLIQASMLMDEVDHALESACARTRHAENTLKGMNETVLTLEAELELALNEFDLAKRSLAKLQFLQEQLDKIGGADGVPREG